MLSSLDFTSKCHSPEVLANAVLHAYYGEIPSFPVNPFEVLQHIGVVVQPRNFRGIEGIYIPAEDEHDVAVVAINKKRPVTRQRYTASHELCHHIKDSGNKEIVCEIGSRNDVEQFAETFASFFLMPTHYIKKVAINYEKNGEVSFDDAITIADYFGVSFKSCIYTLAYRLKKIGGKIDPRTLEKRIKNFQPVLRRLERGFSAYDHTLLKNMVSSYSYALPFENEAIWYKFKIDFIYNENKMENLDVSHEQVAEAITDLRMRKQASIY